MEKQPTPKSSRQRFQEIVEANQPTSLLEERLSFIDDDIEIKELDQELGELD
jgi:hypothetical protein